MKAIINLGLVFIFLIYLSCSMAPYDLQSTTLLENQVIRQPLVVVGTTYNGMIIRNCVFEDISANAAIRIEGVSDLIISNCTIRNIAGHGIRLWHEGQWTTNIRIINNTISNVSYNGILAGEVNFQTTIKGNVIHDVGLDWAGGLLNGAPHHGIYFQGPAFIIESNQIYNNYDVLGNAVSVRSYGIIRGNILSLASKRGITYFSDHPGYGGLLLIENNFIFDNGDRAVGIDSAGDPNWHIGSVIIRFNSMVQANAAPITFPQTLTGVSAEVYGNILVRTGGGDLYIDTKHVLTQYQNLQSAGDAGFTDYQHRDLTLTASSPALGFADGILSFPSNDIQGEARPIGLLDAGADER